MDAAKIDVPDKAFNGATVEIKLPSGKKAQMRRAKVRDQIEAMKVAKTDSAGDLMAAIVARVTLLDGKPLRYEDVIDMDLADGMALQGALSANFPKAPGSSS